MSYKPGQHSHNGHVTRVGVYLAVGLTLLVLTAVTIRVSFIHLEGWNVVVALLIASIKGTLVVLFFMHLLYDKRIYAIVFSMGLLFLSIFIALIMFDTLRRGEIYETKAEPIHKEAKIYENLPAADSSAHSPDQPH